MKLEIYKEKDTNTRWNDSASFSPNSSSRRRNRW